MNQREQKMQDLILERLYRAKFGSMTNQNLEKAAVHDPLELQLLAPLQWTLAFPTVTLCPRLVLLFLIRIAPVNDCRSLRMEEPDKQ